MKTEVEFIYEKELKNDGIIEHAHIIAEASQQISEIAEARKRLRELKETIERHSKYIQDGKISFQTVGEFEWHKPIADYVTIHSIQGDFPEFIRPMTAKEIEEYCELEIPFEAEDSIVVHSKEEAERAKDRLKAVGWNVTDEELDARVTIVELPEKQESERGDEADQEEKTTFPKGWSIEPNSTGKWTVRGSWKDRVQVLGSHPTREAAEAYLKDYLASEAAETDPIEGDGLYIVHTGYSWEVRDKNDPQKGLMAYYPEREKAEIFVELYRKDNNLSNVLSMVRKIYHQRHKEEQPQENLLNSTDNYDVIENVDGSINARMKNA